ncbi:MAG: hypothetical protein PHY23_01015 [Oscillospiraceae bacterium]|nr:hypothetical protein [Oscillospiraceae bacterium]
MNAKANPTMYEAVPVVSELNKVPGFNPLKFLRKTADGPKLDLKYKKLWFRLKYPAGRTRLTPLRITEQLAIIEAKVYFDKNDDQPVGSFISTKKMESTPGGLYVEAAQHDALDEALSSAGFGVQFVSAEPGAPVQQARPAPTVDAGVKASAEPIRQTETIATTTETLQAEEHMEPAKAELVSTMQVEPVVSPAEPTVAIHENETPAVQQEASAQENITAAKYTAPAVLENFAAEPEAAAEVEATAAATETGASYTADMPVDEICALMTIEEAGNIIVPVGTCKGWTLSQVSERRPASLKWYLNGYAGEDNTLRAGARLLLEATMEKAS